MYGATDFRQVQRFFSSRIAPEKDSETLLAAMRSMTVFPRTSRVTARRMLAKINPPDISMSVSAKDNLQVPLEGTHEDARRFLAR